MADWQTSTLGKIAVRDGYGLVDGPFGSNLPASCYTNSGIPVIRGSNLSLGFHRFSADGFVFVSEETASRLERSLCRPGDIIFTKKGTIGQTGIVPRDLPFDRFLISSNQMKLTVDRRVADPHYVYYYVSSPASREKIVRDSEATGVPKTNVQYLRGFPILLPSIPEQKAIARVLGTLDDKIELNRRMNETLEAMARAIFKSWFVDFDPVKAKAEGKTPKGLSPEIANLFPDSYAESLLGPIPKGWKIRTIGDVCTFEYGKALKASNRVQGDVPVYGSNGQVGWHNEKLVHGPGIVVGRKGNPGIVTWADTDFFPIDTTFYVCPSEKDSSMHYLRHMLCDADLARFGADSAVPGLNRNMAYMTKIVWPNRETLQTFDAQARVLRNRVHNNEKESRTLASIRDTLLPKLLSGEIRIKDAEKFAEEVA